MRRILAFLPLIAAACGVPFQQPPTAEELAGADYGPPPQMVSERVTRDVRQRFPEILQVAVGRPRKGWFGELGGVAKARDVRYGWIVAYRAYTVGFLGLQEPQKQGDYFFRNELLEGIAENGEVRFIKPVVGR